VLAAAPILGAPRVRVLPQPPRETSGDRRQTGVERLRAIRLAAATQQSAAMALCPVTLLGRSWATGEPVELPFDEWVGLLRVGHISLCSVCAPCDL
jgi:hypothetical protein